MATHSSILAWRIPWTEEPGKLVCACMHARLLQSCPTLCDPMDCSLLGSSVHGDSPGKNTGVGCHDLLQGIFPTQGLKLGLLQWWSLHSRWILYQLSYRGNPGENEWNP